MYFKRRHFIASSLAAVAYPRLSYADGAHAAFTIVEHNPRAGTVEVIHRLMVLDLELALTARTGQIIRMEDVTDAGTLIGSYLNEYFSLILMDGTVIPLTWVGGEIRLDTLLAYQEAPIASDIEQLTIANQLLTETHPTQINTVNVAFGGRVHSRMFTLGDSPEVIRFDR